MWEFGLKFNPRPFFCSVPHLLVARNGVVASHEGVVARALKKVRAKDDVATPLEALTGKPREGSHEHERRWLVKDEPRGEVGGKALSDVMAHSQRTLSL